ncbi:MAG: hypothetical protein IPQ07_39905 [Myxococcales bacterium]|nr:hypothetical protein [Myxococcales bacterium]
MTAPVNGPRGPVDMRDVAAIHERLDAFKLSLDERAAHEALMRAETRAWMLRSETRTLALVAQLGVPVPVDPERETLSPPTWQERAGAWLSRPASTRAVLALAAAGVLATLSGCVALMGVH